MYQTLKAFIFLILLFSFGCTKKNTPTPTPSPLVTKKESTPLEAPAKEIDRPDGCPTTVTSNFDFSKTHKFESGSAITICAFGTLDQLWGDIFFKSSDTSSALTKIDTFGSPAQGWGMLSMIYKKIELSKNTFLVIDLIPYRDNKRIESTSHTYTCSASSCIKSKNTICVLKKRTSTPKGLAIKKINQFLKTSKDRPTDEDFFEVYLDALDGHKDSLQFYNDTNKFPEIISKSYTYETPEQTFLTLKSYIENLSKNKCI